MPVPAYEPAAARDLSAFTPAEITRRCPWVRDVAALQQALVSRGSACGNALSIAMAWRESPQGHTFWHAESGRLINSGEPDLTLDPDHASILRGWLGLSEEAWAIEAIEAEEPTQAVLPLAPAAARTGKRKGRMRKVSVEQRKAALPSVPGALAGCDCSACVSRSAAWTLVAMASAVGISMGFRRETFQPSLQRGQCLLVISLLEGFDGAQDVVQRQAEHRLERAHYVRHGLIRQAFADQARLDYLFADGDRIIDSFGVQDSFGCGHGYSFLPWIRLSRKRMKRGWRSEPLDVHSW